MSKLSPGNELICLIRRQGRHYWDVYAPSSRGPYDHQCNICKTIIKCPYRNEVEYRLVSEAAECKICVIRGSIEWKP